MTSPLSQKRCWLFDMDGTLTHAIHDFDAIRLSLGLPMGKPILEAIAEQPRAIAASLRRQLDELEMDIALQAKPQPGAANLLAQLMERDCKLGIVTRNGRAIADATLAACGLDGCFTNESIISRDCAPAKPDPRGLELAMAHWQAKPADTVMVGDYLFDLEAGRRAGVTTVHLAVVGQQSGSWPELTDYKVSSLDEVSALIQNA